MRKINVKIGNQIKYILTIKFIIFLGPRVGYLHDNHTDQLDDLTVSD